MSANDAVAIVALALGLPGLATAAHLGLLAIASLFYRPAPRMPHRPIRFLVLVPAHNEERVIRRCLQSIEADRQQDDVVLVVADRCTDATADIARAAGAHVLERGPAEEPGRAAARQAGLDHARSLDWDALVMLDADSVIDRGFFVAIERALASGAKAVQGRSESEPARTLPTEASLAARTLQGVTLPRGKDRLGLSVRLHGTGMATWRDIALTHRFRAPASEDLCFTLDLLLEGVRTRHVDGARLRSQEADSWGVSGGQKVRYEAGRMAAARVYIPRLMRRAVRQRDAACVEAAWFLATPPFALGVLSVLAGLALATVAGAWPLVAVFGAAFLALALVVVTGLIQAGAGLRTWFALLVAPWYLVWKAVVQLRAVASVLRNDDYYPPTARV